MTKARDMTTTDSAAWFYGPGGQPALAIPRYWLEAHTEGRPIEAERWRKHVERQGETFFSLRPIDEAEAPVTITLRRLDVDGAVALQLATDEDEAQLRAWLAARPDIV